MKEFLMQEESGQGMVEYALIIGLISVVAIAALQNIGTNTNTLYEKVQKALEKANEDSKDLPAGEGK